MKYMFIDGTQYGGLYIYIVYMFTIAFTSGEEALPLVIASIYYKGKRWSTATSCRLIEFLCTWQVH